MDDMEKRLSELDGIRTRDVWDRALNGSRRGDSPSDGGGPDGHPLARRAGVIAVALAVSAAGAGLLFAQFASDERRTQPLDGVATSSSVTIDCREPVSVTPTNVRLDRDGVRMVVENAGPADFVYMRDPEKIGRSIGFDIPGETSRQEIHSLFISPGEWLVGCFSTPFSTHEHPVEDYGATLIVEDPEGNWPIIQDEQTCGEPLPAPVETAGREAPLAGPLTGRALLYTWSDDRPGDDVFEISLANLSIAPILAGPGQAWDATWSPDGSRIAFVGGGLEEDSEIYVMNADGTGLTQLTDNDATDDLVEWRPGTDELSFRSNRDGPLTLYVMNADGSDQRRLLDFPSADRHEWSPDGSRLAFVGSDGKDDGDGCHEDHELYVMNADGSGLLRLTDDEYYEQDPSWSPDGSQIAFSASNQSDYAWEVFVVNADGTDLRRLTEYPGVDADPTWSPDGSMIAFSSDRATGPSQTEAQDGTPYVMNADGSGVRRLLDLEAVGLGDRTRAGITNWRSG
jgi:Tol biopolymer transport system component